MRKQGISKDQNYWILQAYQEAYLKRGTRKITVEDPTSLLVNTILRRQVMTPTIAGNCTQSSDPTIPLHPKTPGPHLCTHQPLNWSSKPIVLDSGATHHLVNNPDKFQPTAKSNIKIATGGHSNFLTATAVGTATLINNRGKRLILENALLVPSLTRLLISIPRVFKKEILITKNAEKGATILIDNSFRLLGSFKNNLISFLLLPYQEVMVPKSEVEECAICKECKLKSLPFAGKFKLFNQILAAVHMDLVGPFLVQLLAGYVYFLTLIDQPSKNSWSSKQRQKNKQDVFFACLSPMVGLSNLTPLKTRKMKIPYQIWTGQSVNLDVLRPFGCLTYLLIPKEHRVFKLNPTAEKGIMLGYENEFSSYWILKLEDKKIIRVRNVKFEEFTFPGLKEGNSEDGGRASDVFKPGRLAMPDKENPLEATQILISAPTWKLNLESQPVSPSVTHRTSGSASN
ncbi:uncharacterized protein VP01_1827g4 [Puccinia sorghi]|uniref:Uncharacterized protein n=1 Tax=Puccinia sorghi TaxID=27349 RepID=A0A0L6VE10_9BASI|nr:uncharacterized protein VP01_1827g4 [Puccinia sorghi]